MRQELDDLLCQRYPDIFADRHKKAIYETSMRWGFTCGDGWFNLIDRLCADISTQVMNGSMPPVVARQVKEKFGTLRFHFRGGNSATRALIEQARDESERICSECGQPGEMRPIWAGCVLCPDCTERALQIEQQQ